jgi:hypothetical protein
LWRRKIVNSWGIVYLNVFYKLQTPSTTQGIRGKLLTLLAISKKTKKGGLPPFESSFNFVNSALKRILHACCAGDLL